MRKGWFAIPGVQQGERTLAEQARGLEPALAACKGKTVLDLGCAEGLIAQACLARGARLVRGYDFNAPFLDTAAALELDPARAEFFYYDLNKPLATPPADIVLALAIVHKLRDPAAALAGFAALATERLVLRLPRGSDGEFRAKHSQARCDVRVVMAEAGFRLEQTLRGPRGELVLHWVR